MSKGGKENGTAKDVRKANSAGRNSDSGGAFRRQQYRQVWPSSDGGHQQNEDEGIEGDKPLSFPKKARTEFAKFLKAKRKLLFEAKRFKTDTSKAKGGKKPRSLGDWTR